MNTTEQKIERFIHTLESLGGSAGNQKLRDALGWQEATYDSIKQQLLPQGFIPCWTSTTRPGERHAWN